VPAHRRTVEICNERGLHARASAKFVKAAAGFQCDVKVSKDGVAVDACSIMGLLMLGAGPGSTIEIEADGADAEAAVDFLSDLVACRFEEEK
jgi:phosphocarrier protein